MGFLDFIQFLLKRLGFSADLSLLTLCRSQLRLHFTQLVFEILFFLREGSLGFLKSRHFLFQRLQLFGTLPLIAFNFFQSGLELFQL